TRSQSASTVPSPPSASGNGTHSTPASAKPSPSAAAASRAERTLLRLAGHASALGAAICPRLLLPLGLLVHLGLRGGRHHAQHRERQSLAREEQQADPDPDGCLDRLQAEPERDAMRIS